jgi:hypothetical protein
MKNPYEVIGENSRIKHLGCQEKQKRRKGGFAEEEIQGRSPNHERAL